MSKRKSHIVSHNTHESNKVPNQLSEYLAKENNRFCELCMYFDGLCMDDIKFLKPRDLINLVPYESYRHRLLMTILVRRYLFRECGSSSSSSCDESENTSRC